MPAVPPPRPQAPNFPQSPTSSDPLALYNSVNEIVNYLSKVQINTATPGPVIQFAGMATNLGNILSWNPAINAIYYYIYRNSFAADFSQASLIAILNASKVRTLGEFTYTDTLADSGAPSRYYWILPLNEQGIAGPLSPMVTVKNFFAANGGLALGLDAIANGADSIAIGVNAEASGTDSIALGANTTTAGSSTNSTALGANITDLGSNDTIVGEGNSVGAGNHATVVGQGNTVSGGNAINVGQGNTVTHANVVAIGNGITDSADHQAFLGSSQTDYYLGRTQTHSGAAQNTTIHGTDGTGSNVAGDNLVMQPGLGTGNAATGNFDVNTARAGSSGSTLETPRLTLRVRGDGNIILTGDGTEPVTSAWTSTGMLHLGPKAGTTAGSDANSGFVLYTNNTANANIGEFAIISGSYLAISSDVQGGASQLPIAFFTNHTRQMDLDTSGRLKFLANNATGTGSVALGGNSSSTVNAQPYTWVDVVAADGTLCVIPIWRK